MTTDEKKEKKRSKKKSGPKRSERRFVPIASTNPWIVRILGAVGGLVLGAGLYAYFYASASGHTFGEGAEDRIRSIPSYLIAGGAVIMGVCIWLGTSSEAPIRVGDPGIAVERGEVRRMPWWAVEKISWQSGALALVVAGRDESGTDWTFKVPLAAHPEAVGWIVGEAQKRIKKKLDLDRSLLKKMPAAREHAGQKIDLEPIQVVGRKCAASGQTISYEPDARVCPSCERVYFKRSVPNKCKCGAVIEHLRPANVPAPEGVEEPDEVDDEVDEDDERDDEIETANDERDEDERDDEAGGSETERAAKKERARREDAET